jgi:pimeloyl-ACP methyl ester carboxylesterase
MKHFNCKSKNTLLLTVAFACYIVTSISSMDLEARNLSKRIISLNSKDTILTGNVKVATGDIEYFIEGHGSPIVLLPGASLSTDYLKGLAHALAQTGYQAIRVNPRGAGNSTSTTDSVTMHTLGDDVVAVVTFLKVGKVDVAGHAFGNRIARIIANDHPEAVRSVILLAAGGAVKGKPEADAALNSILNPKTTDAECLKAMQYLVGDSADAKFTWEAIKHSRYLAAAKIELIANKATPLKDWAAPSGNAPFLVIQGSKDQIAPPQNGELLKKQLGNRVTLVLIEGGGHMMAVNFPKQTSSAIVKYLNGLNKIH